MFTQQLMFLKQTMEVGTTSDNLERHTESDCESGETSTEASVEPPGSVSTELPSSPVEEAAELPTRKRKRSTAVQEMGKEIEGRVLSFLEKKPPLSQEESFCKTLQELIRRVPEEKKLKCQLSIMGLVDIFSGPQDPSPVIRYIDQFRIGEIQSYPPLPQQTQAHHIHYQNPSPTYQPSIRHTPSPTVPPALYGSVYTNRPISSHEWPTIPYGHSPTLQQQQQQAQLEQLSAPPSGQHDM
ncbi:uncharacterized protein [Dendropsophus ebraccatus]|uniref:uncharacterized protein n=1 Tax=Dendropsophus ebraccatus TaxID=150705 RepID=UPI003831D478